MVLDMATTKVLQEILEAYYAKKRRILLEGGTSSSKTYSAIQAAILLAEGDKTPTISSVVSESLPHLKKGAIRDFFTVLKQPMKHNPNYNATDCIYTFPGSGSIIEFFGANESGKVHGPRRDRLFVNECNNVPWTTVHALDIRTKYFTMADWNPTGEFWAHEYESGGKMVAGWLKNPENAYSHSTYLDAKHLLPPEVVTNIESNRHDANWWHIYGLGLLGKVEGLVYRSDFTQVPSLPERGEHFYGMDFGYSVDPSVLLHLVIIGMDLYAQQLFFQRGMENDVIAEAMIDHNVRTHYDQIWADSAEPKSIAEIHRFGFNIQGASKGPGSVKQRIQLRNQYKMHWTEDSLECIKEQRNCRYVQDKDGKLTDKITHQWSHGMDACDYGVVGYVTPPEDIEEVVEYYDPVAISPV